LSFGQRRRVALATVLSMDPSILVLDEPTSNLDPASRRELATILHDLPLTLLLATHDLPYALELCPRAVIMNEGRVVADGCTAELLADGELLRENRLELPYAFDMTSLH
jgi:cobalt/nickel transport system ATP-binding protein